MTSRSIPLRRGQRLAGPSRVFHVRPVRRDVLGALQIIQGITPWHVEAFKLRGLSYCIRTEDGDNVWLVTERPDDPRPRIEITPEELVQKPKTLPRRVRHLAAAISVLGGGYIERIRPG